METNNKLREALIEIIDYLEPIRKWTMPSKENRTRLTALFAAVDTVYTKAKAALAEPVKNCEVGTPEEQANRWYWRYHVGHLCQSCPLGPRKWSEIGAGWFCFSEWLQMPYEEGGAK